MKEVCLQNLASQQVETVRPSLVCIFSQGKYRKPNKIAHEGVFNQHKQHQTVPGICLFCLLTIIKGDHCSPITLLKSLNQQAPVKFSSPFYNLNTLKVFNTFSTCIGNIFPRIRLQISHFLFKLLCVSTTIKPFVILIRPHTILSHKFIKSFNETVNDINR